MSFPTETSSPTLTEAWRSWHWLALATGLALITGGLLL